MPSFGGDAIFGAASHIATSDNERSTQTNAFFGLQGIEELDGGFRGRVTQATGLLYAGTPAALANIMNVFRSYQDGAYYTLVDNDGTTWLNVRLRGLQFNPAGIAHSQLGYVRAYQAIFHHLT